MRKIIWIFIIVGIVWQGNGLYQKYGSELFQQSPSPYSVNSKCITKDGKAIYGTIPIGITCEKMEPIKGSLTILPSETSNKTGNSERSSYYNSHKENSNISNFKCDGRTYCSQMTSCEEATFFLANCPDVKMDGNNDGVPCERQWCK